MDESGQRFLVHLSAKSSGGVFVLECGSGGVLILECGVGCVNGACV